MPVNPLKFSVYLAVSLAIIILNACSKDVKPSAPAAAMPPTMVSVDKPRLGSLTESIIIAGNLQASQQTILSSEREGIIEEIFVSGGGTVKAGQVLMKMSRSTALAELKRAQAEVKLRKWETKRAQSLSKMKVNTQYDLAKALADLGTALANEEVIQVELNKHVIKAPFSGQLGIRKVNVGDYVNKGEPLIELVSLNPLYVDFKVAETAIGTLDVGKKISVNIPAMQNLKIDAVIKIISPSIDEKTHSISVRAAINNTHKKLKPGLFAKVDLPISESKNVLWLPQTAIFQQGKNDMLMINDEGVARRVIVEVAGYDNEEVAITSGISVNDIIVVAGHHKVPFDGMPIIAANVLASEITASNNSQHKENQKISPL